MNKRISDSQNTSEFAQLLRRLLDDTGIFNRSEWAEFLSVSTAAISQWVNDNTVPRPELLRMIVDLVRSVDNAPQGLLQEFETMAARPSEVVSPNGKRFGESVSAYLVRPLLDGFLLDLKGLKSEEQARVLLRASMLCAEEAASFRNPPVESSHEPLTLVSFIAAPKGDLLPELLERAEAAVARIEKRIPDLLVKVMNYLTSTPDQSLLREATAFCVQAVAHVRAQRNNKPMMLISKIIESDMIDPSRFDRISERDALNALFIADEETAILVRQRDDFAHDNFARLEKPADMELRELEEAVAALRGVEVQYIPEERLPQSYRLVSIERVKDAA